MAALPDFSSRLQRLILEKHIVRVEHPLWREYEAEKLRVAGSVIELLHNREFLENGLLVVIKGPMRAGKSTILSLIMLCISSDLYQGGVKFIRLNDGRPFADRNNISLPDNIVAQCVDPGIGAQSIINQINNGEIKSNSLLFLSEAQFYGPIEKLSELLRVCKEKRIILVADCLSIFFTGYLIPGTNFLSNYAGEDCTFSVHALDVYGGEGWGEIPMRVIPLYPNGELVEPDTDKELSPSVSLLSIEQRLALMKIIDETPELHFLKQDGVYLIPSSESDATYIPGDKRYLVVGRALRDAVFKSLGIKIPEAQLES